MQHGTTLTVLATLLSAASAGTFCDVLGSNLPSFCTCTDATLGFDLKCSQSFADDLFTTPPSVASTFKLTACGTPEMSVSAKATIAGTEHTLATKKYSFPKEITIPIDGATLTPFTINLYVNLGGDVGALKLDLELDACATLAGATVCGADIPTSIFVGCRTAGVCKSSTNPFRIPVLKKTLSFTDACATSSSTTGATSSSTTAATSTYAVKSTVSLEGITAAQFDAAAQNAFKEVIAGYLTICGTTGTTQCTSSDVTIVSSSRRDVSVQYQVPTTSQAIAAEGANALSAAVVTNAAKFKDALVAKGGNLASVTGSTTTTVPAVDTTTTSSVGHIEAGSMVFSLLTALAALFA